VHDDIVQSSAAPDASRRPAAHRSLDECGCAALAGSVAYQSQPDATLGNQGVAGWHEGYAEGTAESLGHDFNTYAGLFGSIEFVWRGT
jgi:hypothetical protein